MIEHVCVTQSHKLIKALEYYRFLQYFIIAEEVKHAQQRRSQRALLFFLFCFEEVVVRVTFVTRLSRRKCAVLSRGSKRCKRHL
jgi:hypothetical protein